MRDTELYQTLLGLMPPWAVTAANITQVSADRPLGEVAVTVRWRADAPLVCPGCGQVAPGYDSRPRRWRHPRFFPPKCRCIQNRRRRKSKTHSHLHERQAAVGEGRRNTIL